MSAPFTYKNILVLGAAESGVGAALLAKARGIKVFVSEKGAIDPDYKLKLSEAHIPFEENGHHHQDDFDIIIKSPGISDKVPIVQEYLKRGLSVISEIEFAWYFTNSKIIAVTGTNGKSTTVSLIYHIMKKAGLDVSLVGNIGRSFAWQIAEKPTAYYVIEISSFQLDNCYNFRPHIAVLTNISNNHLDRYEYQMQNYAAAKYRLIQSQTTDDYFIYNADDEGIISYLPAHITPQILTLSQKKAVVQGAYIENNQIHYKLKNTLFTMNLFDLALQGKHNAYNSMAAGVAAQILEIRKETIRESLQDFKSLEHRLEFVASANEIDYINDSKATNVNSVWYALESMNKPVIWIAGGIDKGNDYSLIQDIVKNKVKAIVCLGKDNRKIHEAFGRTVDMIVNTESMKDAVHAARHFAAPGDVVLLSPGCASFDLFEDFEDRGRQFKQEVKSL
jgi:UDP-N-acetylmuramoylalanine--D-glutamate ligase